MREIEIKSILTNKNFAINKLRRLNATCKEKIYQHDKIFLHKSDNNLLKLKKDSIVLRIRKQELKTEITVKVHQSNELDCLEENLVINDKNIDNIINFINLLGYKESIEVKKERLSCKLGKYTICIDSVEGLGDYLEIEYLANEATLTSSEEIYNDMKKIMFDLGVKMDDFVFHGYDTLLFIRDGQNNDF